MDDVYGRMLYSLIRRDFCHWLIIFQNIVFVSLFCVGVLVCGDGMGYFYYRMFVSVGSTFLGVFYNNVYSCRSSWFSNHMAGYFFFLYL